jgi:hypothetical protein
MESTIGNVKPLITELKNGEKECENSGSDVICTQCVKGDCENGKGTLIDSVNGEMVQSYEGEFKNSEFHGKGKYKWHDGIKSDGYWKNGDRDGFNIMIWPDGQKFEGNFKQGNYDGYGKMTYPDGRVEKGIWKDDKLVTPDKSEGKKTSEVISNTDCNSLKSEAEKQTKWNPSNLSSGKVVIGLKNQGPIVKYVQCLLNGKNKELSLGLPDLTVDGIFGNQTKKMVRKFQEKIGGLGTDGVVGKGTFSKLV